ncbi:MAG: hypothetical protein CEN88_314 [Candidatus Berkelbacteria bacterium Licking1014_2]|uniref:Uncharacterized protein n=1 Tax=Candidatus Berkelbacteria bacterium Licking1014_2 TaxID=2017146 RepID=A0A554LUM7_9BACT|nr:MAG: hypothetical protein CEN88_314 [Candidatus Berkelbacteria bacterium Licking1014_2]
MKRRRDKEGQTGSLFADNESRGNSVIAGTGEKQSTLINPSDLFNEESIWEREYRKHLRTLSERSRFMPPPFSDEDSDDPLSPQYRLMYPRTT